MQEEKKKKFLQEVDERIGYEKALADDYAAAK